MEEKKEKLVKFTKEEKKEAEDMGQGMLESIRLKYFPREERMKYFEEFADSYKKEISRLYVLNRLFNRALVVDQVRREVNANDKKLMTRGQRDNLLRQITENNNVITANYENMRIIADLIIELTGEITEEKKKKEKEKNK